MLTAIAMILFGIVTFTTTLIVTSLSKPTDQEKGELGINQSDSPTETKRQRMISAVFFVCITLIISGFTLLFWRSSTASPEQIQQVLNQSADPECIRLKLRAQVQKKALTREQVVKASHICNTGSVRFGEPPIRIQQLKILEENHAD